MNKRKCSMICCLIVGIVCFLIGIVLVSAFSAIVAAIIKAQVPLRQEKDGSYDFSANLWAKPPFRTTIQYWFFNTTNHGEIMSKGAKPTVVQHGPYGYIEVGVKQNVTFENGGRDIIYYNHKTFYWSPEYSCSECSPEDLMTVPNLVLLLAADLINSTLKTAVEKELASGLLATVEKTFVSKTVRELLYEGYSDFLVNATKLPILKPIVKALHLKLPDRIGFFYGKNGTNDGEYNIRSGIDSVKTVGQINLWNNSTFTPPNWWSTNQSSMVNGTDGELFSPFMTRQDVPRLFVSDLCRSIYAEFKRDIAIEGIPGYRFYVPGKVFDCTRPENAGNRVQTRASSNLYYNIQKQYPKFCIAPGFLDVTHCQPATPPVVGSFPHFLYSPGEVIDSVQGLNPIEEEHQTSIDIEPNTGIPMQLNKRIQVNLAITHYKNIIQFQHVKNTILPVLWQNESGYIDPHTRDYIYNQIVTGRSAGMGIAFGLLAVGGFIFVALLTVVFVGMYRRTMTERTDDNGTFENPILPQSSSDSQPGSPEPSRRAVQSDNQSFENTENA